MEKLLELLRYVKAQKLTNFKSAAFLFSKYATDQDKQDLAESIYNESIIIDLDEMESLVNADKFEYPKGKIGLIGIENDTDS